MFKVSHLVVCWALALSVGCAVPVAETEAQAESQAEPEAALDSPENVAAASAAQTREEALADLSRARPPLATRSWPRLTKALAFPNPSPRSRVTALRDAAPSQAARLAR